MTLDDLCSIYYPKILRRIDYLLGGNHELAADLTQITFLKATRAFPHLAHDANLSAWLYTIATRTVYDNAKQEKTRMICASLDDPDSTFQLIDELADPDSRYGDRELATLAWRRLNNTDRQTLSDYINGKLISDRRKVYRARQNLAKLYQRLQRESEVAA